jgi:hypothetical protein
MTSTTTPEVEIGEWKHFVVSGSRFLILRKYRFIDFGRAVEVKIGDLGIERGTFLIDTEDFPKYKEFTWYKNNDGYIVSTPSKALKYKYVIPRKHYRIHQALLPGFKLTDHKNGNRSDNRRSNLRGSDSLQNSNNMKLFNTNKSGINGVFHETLIRKNRTNQPIHNCYCVKTHRLGDNRKGKVKKFWYGKIRTKEEAFKLAVEYRKNWDKEHDCFNGLRPK